MLLRGFNSSRARPRTATSRDAAAAKSELAIALERREHERSFELATTLEELEPADPRWPRRCGDLLRLAGRPHDAASAYRRAAQRYEQQGFSDRAKAMSGLARTLAEQSAHLVPEHTSITPEVPRR
jgi:hypothetical protein